MRVLVTITVTVLTYDIDIELLRYKSEKENQQEIGTVVVIGSDKGNFLRLLNVYKDGEAMFAGWGLQIRQDVLAAY